MSTKFKIPDIPWHLIDEAKRKIRKVWALEDLDLRDPALLVNWERLLDARSELNATAAQRIADPELDVRCQFEINVRRQIESLEAGEEIGTGAVNMPGLNMVHFGTGPLATAFGATWVVRDHDQPFFKPAVHTPEEALRLVKPDLRHGGILPLILERIDYYNEATQGRIPITPCDTAGPWSIATQIWHYEDMLEAIHTAPEAVRYLLDLVTDCIIEFYNIQETRIGRWSGTHVSFPWPWYPRGIGIGDDCMVCVSPATWEEFFLPYNNRLSREYGGLFYHCCLCYENHLSSLAKTENFMGFDADPKYNSIVKIEAALTGRGVLTTPIGLGLPGGITGSGFVEANPETLEDALSYIHRLRGKAGLFLGIQGENRQDAIDKAKRLLDNI